MAKLIRRSWRPVVLWSCMALMGCGRAEPELAPPPPPEIMVSLPVTRTVTDYEDFTGRTDAVKTVEIRARVTGYLDKVYFEEGTEVVQGTPLFEIDPRPYRTAYDQAVGNLESMEARLKRQDGDLKRAERLVATKALSNEDYEKIIGDRGETAASFRGLRAAVERAKQDLDWTKVTAPISGRLSRQYIDPGNVVKAEDTVLTTIVSLDPMYVYFDVDERTHLRLKRLALEAKTKSVSQASVPVFMGLADELGYPHEGKINFEDNRIDS